MPYIEPNNLLKPTEKVIKPYNCSFIAVDGPTIKSKLNLEGVEVPYDSQFVFQDTLQAGETDKPVLYGFLGNNISFLMIKAIYEPFDPNWQIEEEQYIEYYFEDDPTTVRYMGKLLLLSGNSIKKVPQVYLNNPNSEQVVHIEILAADIRNEDLSTDNILDEPRSIYGLYYNSLISDSVDSGSTKLYITDAEENVQLSIPYININTIEKTNNDTNRLIIGTDSEEDIYLHFLSEYNMNQAHSRLSWVLEDKENRKLTLSSPPVDISEPVILFNPGISSTGYTIISTGYTGDIIDLFISGVTDTVDGEIDKYDVRVTIYEDNNLVPVSSVYDSGLYELHFQVEDIAANVNKTIKKLNVGNVSIP